MSKRGNGVIGTSTQLTLRPMKRIRMSNDDATPEQRAQSERNILGEISRRQQISSDPKSIGELMKESIQRKLAEDPSQFNFAPEQRFRCLRCRDSGWVEIWHPDTIADAVRTDGNPKRWHTCLCLCTCSAADKVPTHFSERISSRRAGQPIPVFGEKRWHIAVNEPDARAKAAMYQHQPDNYYDEFAGDLGR